MMIKHSLARKYSTLQDMGNSRDSFIIKPMVGYHLDFKIWELSKI